MEKHNNAAIIICHLLVFGCVIFYLLYFTFGIDYPLISGETKTLKIDLENLDYHIQLRKIIILLFIFLLVGCITALWKLKKFSRNKEITSIIIFFEILILIFSIVVYFASQMFII